MKPLRDRVTPEGAAKLARFAALAVISIFGFGAIAFGVLAIVAGSRASEQEARIKALVAEQKKLEDVLDEAQRKGAVGVDDHSRAVAAFQRSVSRLAQSLDCELNEFLASTDIQPFLTRFEKQPGTNGWSQIEAQVTLTGPARFIHEVLGRLAEQDVPIEFNSVLINREDVDEAGSRVKAKILLRILVQAGGGQA